MAQKDCDKRPNYFAGQYLLEDDFELEQSYHIDRQRRHNRLLHVSGIADGLNVKPEGNLTVKISAGTAIDKNGQQIVWSTDMEKEPVNLQVVNNAITDGNYILSIGYVETEKKLIEPQEGTTDKYRRWYEKPDFNLVLNGQPLPEGFIALAKLTIDGKKVTIDDSDKNIRQYSGLRLPSTNQTNAPTLRSGGDNASNLAVLNGSLSVTDKVGIGTTSPGAKLEVKGDKNDYTTAALNVTDSTSKSLLYVRNDGNVGIGTTTPGGKLNIIDSFQNAIGTTLILGSTDASNLRLGYDQEYSWIQSHGGKPLAINSLGNNVGIGTTDPKQQLVVNGGKASIGYNDAQQTAALAVNGNIGIGTITPTVKLEVSGGDLKVSGNISATGNVGIGTTSPAAKLQVRDTIASRNNYDFSKTALLINAQTHNGGNSPAKPESILALAREGVSGQTFGNMVDFQLSNHQNAGTQLDLYLTKQGTFLQQQVMSLRANGTVGIGTADPQTTLEVTGIIKAKAYQVTTQIAGGKDEDALRNLQTTNIYKQPPGWRPEPGEDLNKSVWQPFPDLKQEITLSATATILVFYNISIPAGTNGTYIVTRLKINDKIVTRTICTDRSYQRTTDLWFGELSSGKHSITVEIRIDAVSQTSNTQLDDWQNRVLRVLIFGT